MAGPAAGGVSIPGHSGGDSRREENGVGRAATTIRTYVLQSGGWRGELATQWHALVAGRVEVVPAWSLGNGLAAVPTMAATVPAYVGGDRYTSCLRRSDRRPSITSPRSVTWSQSLRTAGFSERRLWTKRRLTMRTFPMRRSRTGGRGDVCSAVGVECSTITFHSSFAHVLQCSCRSIGRPQEHNAQ